MFLKNIVFLVMIYGTIAGHYISAIYYISLGACFAVFYFFNLTI